MRLLLDQDAMVGGWVAERLPEAMRTVIATEPFRAFGVVDAGGELAGGVIYHGYRQQERSIEMSCAASRARWLTQGILRALFGYAFVNNGCQRVTAWVAGSNARSRRLLGGLGFRQEGVMRRALGEDDAVVFGLLEEEWRAGPFGPIGGTA